MAGPWDDYATEAPPPEQTAAGPWQDYAQPSTGEPPPSAPDGDPAQRSRAALQGFRQANTTAADASRIYDRAKGIASAFGEGFGEAWGPERLGLSDDTKEWLASKNVLPGKGADYSDPSKPFMAFNEGVILPLAAGIDAAWRTTQGLYRGAQEAGVAAGLPKDVVSIPDMLMGSPGMLARPKPFVKPEPIRPVEYAPSIPGVEPAPPPIPDQPANVPPAGPRVRAAQTGIPEVDRVLNSPTTRHVIDNPVVDRSHTVPNSWGGADALENPTTYIDHEFPKEITGPRQAPDGPSFTVYHGSPHHFEKFDISKLGTGEGAAAYGRGLYFAENRKVAEGYKEALSTGSPESPEDVASTYLRAMSSREAAIDALREHAANPKEDSVSSSDTLRKAAEILESGHNPEHPGRLYTVRINADRDNFIDWDKTLGEQSQHVRQALEGVEIRPIIYEVDGTKNVQHGNRPSDSTSMSHILLNIRAGDGAGAGAALAASELRRVGIPGIKYLDAGSRAGEDEGATRNFVLVDDSLADVTHINDKSVGVKFDPADPAVVHENVEHAVIDHLVKAGWDREAALRVAFWGWGQPAEHAWYRAHGIDPDAVEAIYQPILDRIAARDADNVPPDLFRGTYDDWDPAKASAGQIERPTDAELTEARKIIGSAAEFRQPDEVIHEARQAGVIGEEPPSPLKGTPQDAGRGSIPPSLPGERPPPGAPGGPPEEPSPWRQRFEHFLGSLETTEDAKALIRNAVDRNNEFPAARAGDIPLRQVDQLAEATGIDPSNIDRTGTGRLLRNDDQVRNAIEAMRTIDQKVKLLAEQIEAKAGTNDADELAELTKLRIQRSAVLDATVEQVVGLRAEWGRTGNAIQEFLKVKDEPGGLGRFLKDKKGETTDDLRQIAKMIANTDDADVPRALDKLRQAPPGALYWTWVQGLISGTVTHTKYLGANELFALAIHGIETPLASVVQRVLRATGVQGDIKTPFDFGPPDRIFASEGMAGLVGHFAAVPEAFVAAGKAFATGIKPPLASEVALFNQAVERNKALRAAGQKGEKIPLTLERANAQIPSAEPENFKIVPFTDPQAWYNLWSRKLVSTPSRSANAIHTFFRVLGENASNEALATRQTLNEGIGLTDPRFLQRQRYWATNPTDTMLARTTEDAYYSTFMQDLGPAGKLWQAATRNIPGLRWLFPFNHIPVNILKAGVERTPFAFAGPEMRARLLGERGDVEQAVAISRMITGSAIMGYFGWKYLNGQATGDYPTDPKDRQRWKDSGKIPNAILMGNSWVSLDKLGPAGDVAKLGIGMGGAWEKYREGDDDAYSGAAWKAAESAGRFVSEGVGFQGLSNIFEAMQSEDKAVALTSTTVATAIPFSSMMSQTASINDPQAREVKTFLDGLKYRIPALRNELLPKRDWLGEPLPNPQYGSLVRQLPVQTDPVKQEAMAIGDATGRYPAAPSDRIQNVKLPPRLYDQYQALAGGYTKTALETFVSQPGWSEMPMYVRAEAFHRIIEKTREQAGRAMMLAHPEILQQAITNKGSQIAGEKPGKLRD